MFSNFINPGVPYEDSRQDMHCPEARPGGTKLEGGELAVIHAVQLANLYISNKALRCLDIFKHNPALSFSTVYFSLRQTSSLQ